MWYSVWSLLLACRCPVVPALFIEKLPFSHWIAAFVQNQQATFVDLFCCCCSGPLISASITRFSFIAQWCNECSLGSVLVSDVLGCCPALWTLISLPGGVTLRHSVLTMFSINVCWRNKGYLTFMFPWERATMSFKNLSEEFLIL